MARTLSRSRRRNDDGTANIEFLGVLPIAIIIAGAMFQLFLIGYAAVEAESGARLAAREASRGAEYDDAERTGEAQTSDFFTVNIDVRGGSGSYTEPGVDDPQEVEDAVTAESKVNVPFLGFGIDDLDFEVTREAVMPYSSPLLG